MSKESEKNIEQYLNQRVAYIHGRSYKWVSPGKRGVPDRICIFPKNIFRLVELKSEGESLEPLQEMVHAELAEVTDCVYVIDTKYDVDVLIYNILVEILTKKQNENTVSDFEEPF